MLVAVKDVAASAATSADSQAEALLVNLQDPAEEWPVRVADKRGVFARIVSERRSFVEAMRRAIPQLCVDGDIDLEHASPRSMIDAVDRVFTRDAIVGEDLIAITQGVDFREMFVATDC